MLHLIAVDLNFVPLWLEHLVFSSAGPSVSRFVFQLLRMDSYEDTWKLNDHCILFPGFISGMQIVTAQSQGGPVPPPGLPRPDPPYFQGFYNSASLGPNSLTMSADLLVTDYVPFDPDSIITRSRQFELARILLQREMACTKSCTGHGLCDNVTKFCVCEYFWTQNPFKEWHRPAAMHNNCGKVE